MSPAAVRLNVYDMYWLNDYASTIGFGIFHSGVEVYGTEYAYGGHQFPFSGVFTNQPQDAEELGENFKFRESIYIGETNLSKKAVEKLVKSLGDDFRGDRYHLITKNCNHFTADLARELTGIEVPGWVNRLANLSNSIPFLDKWLPQEWLSPMSLNDSTEERKTERPVRTTQTLNYPIPIERAQEAIFECGSPESIRRGDAQKSSSVSAQQTSTWRFFRRSSEIGGSAPSTARSTPGPAISRLWNSIKSLRSDELSPSSSPNVQRAAKTQPVEID